MTGSWDELLFADGTPRPAAASLISQLQSMGTAELQERQNLAEFDILGMGVTFTVYSDGRGTDRAWPFDIIPRIIEAAEWRRIEAGLVQRLGALNQFIDDLYHDQNVIKDGIVPTSIVESSPNYRPECAGVSPRFGVWAHICGTDLVRGGDGTVFVLEDNLRVPSGVSYMLQNRAISVPGSTDVTTPAEEGLRRREGVCQDFAHLAIGSLRSLGLPARYVSGYVETEAPEGMTKMVGSDASYAWFATFIPGWGWLDLDPTNDQAPPVRHVTLAWGRDYTDVAPLRGVLFGPTVEQQLSVSVDVARV